MREHLESSTPGQFIVDDRIVIPDNGELFTENEGLFADDVLYHIFQFLDAEFMFKVCKRVSIQWHRTANKAPIILNFSSESSKHKRCEHYCEHWPNVELKMQLFYMSNNKNSITELNVEDCCCDRSYLSKFLISDEGSIFLKDVKRLNLANNQLTYKDVISILESSYCNNLTELNISYNAIKECDMQEILNNETLKNIVSLDLSGNEFSETNMTLLCHNLTRLSRLTLADMKIGNSQQMQYFGKSFNFQNLHELSLKRTNLLSAELFENYHKMKNLTRLNLSYCNLKTKDITEISKNSHMKHLKVLELEGNRIGNSEFTSIISMKKLTELHLSTNSIQSIDSSVSVLESNLFYLNLSDNKIDEKGIATILSKITFQNLKSLNLARNNIGHNGIIHICKSKTMRHLTFLDLTGTKIKDQGANALGSSSSYLKKLKVLRLDDSKLGCNGIEVMFSTGSNFKHLTELSMRDNRNIGYPNQSIEILASCAALRNLTILDLSRCNIADEGIKALCENGEHFTQLSELNVSFCNLTTRSLQYLLQCDCFQQLTKLSMAMNYIRNSNVDEESFRQHFPSLKIFNYQGYDRDNFANEE
ncbi:hypothetical protein C9374_005611 [Naegleria lovaniensis]|uniref:Uncharacterized protein n=1 Tax=Naegleria lovaniensis TaxID=51637 RepID=A0AA88GK29_NAELO|nr:uncharacterized protein C9374_005611 [Naegleria lovaniensis]KAG2382409.1 hypothetical protein C9374_005611 [Naegleria lovaniensis]